jgi:hypothetical protein
MYWIRIKIRRRPTTITLLFSHVHQYMRAACLDCSLTWISETISDSHLQKSNIRPPVWMDVDCCSCVVLSSPEVNLSCAIHERKVWHKNNAIYSDNERERKFTINIEIYENEMTESFLIWSFDLPAFCFETSPVYT